MNAPKEVVKKFLEWIKVKIFTHISERRLLFKEGEIWWVSIGHNIGTESNGKHEKFERPVLILKFYNKESFLGMMVSSQKKEGKYYHSKTINGIYYSFNLSQVRNLSSKRLLRHIDKVSREDLQIIRESFFDTIRS